MSRSVYYDEISLDANETKKLIEVTEGGTLLYLLMYTLEKTIQFNILVDNRQLRIYKIAYLSPTILNTRQPDQREGITLAQYDATGDHYSIVITIPLKWERSLEVIGKNPTGGGVQTDVACIYEPSVPLVEPIRKEDVQAPTEKKAWWWPF